MNKQLIHKISLVAAGVCIGSGTTYILLKNKIERDAQARADEQIKSVKETYEIIHDIRKKNDAKKAEEVAQQQYRKAFNTIMVNEGYKEASDEEAANERAAGYSDEEHNPEESETQAEEHEDLLEDDSESDEGTVFVTPQITENPGPKTKSKVPYIITVDEFMEKNPDLNHERITIKYYEYDNTLTDENETVIPDIAGTTGEANLSKFGPNSGSGDESILYVRNERLGADFEVILDEGAYTEQVLGITMDEKPRKRKPKKMRNDD